eukprot:5830066-Pleurochrysis_carterae.AAC.2
MSRAPVPRAPARLLCVHAQRVVARDGARARAQRVRSRCAQSQARCGRIRDTSGQKGAARARSHARGVRMRDAPGQKDSTRARMPRAFALRAIACALRAHARRIWAKGPRTRAHAVCARTGRAYAHAARVHMTLGERKAHGRARVPRAPALYACASARRAHARRVGAKEWRARTHTACTCAARVRVRAACACTTRRGQGTAHARTFCVRTNGIPAHAHTAGVAMMRGGREDLRARTHAAQAYATRVRERAACACATRRGRGTARTRTSRAPARRACACVVRAHAC